MYLIMVCGMFFLGSLCVSVCMLTVSNATVIVRSDGFVLVEACCDGVVYVV